MPGIKGKLEDRKTVEPRWAITPQSTNWNASQSCKCTTSFYGYIFWFRFFRGDDMSAENLTHVPLFSFCYQPCSKWCNRDKASWVSYISFYIWKLNNSSKLLLHTNIISYRRETNKGRIHAKKLTYDKNMRFFVVLDSPKKNWNGYLYTTINNYSREYAKPL
jgi:hypothetical protein